jgi:hypothetical protein
MIQDSNAPSDMQPWVRQTEEEIEKLKSTIERVSSELQVAGVETDTSINSALADSFTFTPRVDAPVLTQANAIDFIGDITSSASVKVDGSITVGQKSEFTEGAEGVEVTGSAPYFEVNPGNVEVNPVTGKQFSTPGTFKVNDISLDMNAYGQIAGNGLSISLSNDSDLMGYAQSILNVTYGVIYIEGSDWVEGQPLDEIPVIVYEIPLTDTNRALFVAGAYVDVEGINPVEFDIPNGLISEVEIDEIGLKLYFKIQGENLAFTYVSGGQVSLNSPSQKYEGVISVKGPGQENDYNGSRISQYGVFVGPNGGSEYEAKSSLEAGGLVTPIVNAKQQLVVAQTGIYVQEEEPSNPADGDLWINPAGVGQVWELASKVNSDIARLPISHNYVLNSGFDILQRGTGDIDFGATVYSADQWKVGRGASSAGGRFSISGSPPTSFDRAVVIRRISGTSGTSSILLTQNFETAGKALQNKLVTLSFYAQAGTSYSAIDDRLIFGIYSSSIAPESVAYASGGLFLSSNPGFLAQSSTAYLTTAEYVRYSAQFSIPSDADALQIFFQFVPTGTAGTDDWYRITGVQLEENGGREQGESLPPTAFKRNSPNLQAELAACQRYYQRMTPNTTATTYWSSMQATSTTAAIGNIPLRTTMRSSPTASFSSPANFRLTNSAGTALTTTALTSGVTSPNFIRVNATVASGIVAGAATMLLSTTTSAFVEMSSEL